MEHYSRGRRKQLIVAILYVASCLFYSEYIYSQQVKEESKQWDLAQCVSYALENNISIKIGALENGDSELEKRQAIGNFLPTINFNTRHTWNTGLAQNLTTGLLENNTTQFTSGGLSVGIDVFKGLQNLTRLYRANLSILAAEYNLEDIKTSITVEIVNAYLQILFNKETLKTAQAQLDANKGDLQKTKQLVEQGISAQGDLFEIEANVATAEQNVIIAENDLRLAKITLAQTLTLEDIENFDIKNETFQLRSADIMNKTAKEVIEQAKKRYYALKIAETNVGIAEKDYKISKGMLLPTVSLFYNYNTRIQYSDREIGFEIDPNNPTREIGVLESTNQSVVSPNYRPIIGSHDDISNQLGNNGGHTFGISLNIPILNGFQASNNVKRQKIELDRKYHQFKQATINFEKLMYQTWNNVRGAHNTYLAAKKTLLSIKEAYKYSDIGYKSGIRNIFEFTQAKSRLQKAEADFIKAKYDFLFKLMLLEFYFGVPISDFEN